MTESFYCCLLCLNPDTNKIKYDKITKEINGVSIKSMLENVIGKSISTEELPELICDFCTKDVLIANNVKLKFEESETILRRMLKDRKHINNSETTATFDNLPASKSDENEIVEVPSNEVAENIDQNSTLNGNKYFFYKDPNGNRLICGHCHKNLVNKKQLVRHISEVHIKKVNFRCEKCDKGFFRKQNYEIHMRSHTRFKCNICKTAEFNIVSDLVEHKATHVNHEEVEEEEEKVKVDKNSESARTCVLCWKLFSRRDNLFRHIKKVHKILPKDLPAIQEKIEEQERLLQNLEADDLELGDLQFTTNEEDASDYNQSYVDSESAEALADESDQMEAGERNCEETVEKIDVILEPNEELTAENIEKYREGLRYLVKHTRPRKKEKRIFGTCQICFHTFTRKDNFLRHLKMKHNLEINPADYLQYVIPQSPSPDLNIPLLEPEVNINELKVTPDLSIVKNEPDETICDIIEIKQEPLDEENCADINDVIEPDPKKVKVEDAENVESDVLNTQIEIKTEDSGNSSCIKIVPMNMLKDPTLNEKPTIICIICNKIFRTKYNLDRHVTEVHLTV